MSRHLILTVALLTPTLSSCCGLFGDEDPTVTLPPPTAITSAASSCSTNSPVALGFTAETGQESEVLPTLTGCTDRGLTKTYLHNAHESMVWLIDRRTLSWNSDHPNPTIQIFRDGVALMGQLGLTLEPGQEVTLDASPARFT